MVLVTLPVECSVCVVWESLSINIYLTQFLLVLSPGPRARVSGAGQANASSHNLNNYEYWCRAQAARGWDLHT